MSMYFARSGTMGKPQKPKRKTPAKNKSSKTKAAPGRKKRAPPRKKARAAVADTVSVAEVAEAIQDASDNEFAIEDQKDWTDDLRPLGMGATEDVTPVLAIAQRLKPAEQLKELATQFQNGNIKAWEGSLGRYVTAPINMISFIVALATKCGIGLRIKCLLHFFEVPAPFKNLMTEHTEVYLFCVTFELNS